MKNKFKLDENLPKSALEVFTSKDFDTENVYDEGISGCTDNKIVEICEKEKRVLITQDLDFSDINLLLKTKIKGIVMLRIKNQSTENVNNILKKFMEYLKTHIIDHQLIILDENKLRIKELEPEEN